MKPVGLSAWVLAFGCLASSCRTFDPGPRVEPPAPLQIQLVGEIDHPDLTEISGLAPSQLRPDRLWVLNDSGNAPKLYAIGTDGTPQGSFTVGGAENRDWEDLASYRKDGTNWLVVGEMGDNDARHSRCRLIFVEEPSSADGRVPEVINPARVIEFCYEDGPRDAEGLSVDLLAGKIYLLSKRTQPPVLYELPLEAAEGDGVQVARRVVEVSGVAPPSLAVQMAAPVKGKYSAMPTAMDGSADGARVLIMTYRDLYVYPSADLQAGKASAVSKRLPHLKQAEAACFSIDGSLVYFTSEKRPAPLYCMTLPE